MTTATLERAMRRRVKPFGKHPEPMDSAWDASRLRAAWDRVRPEATPVAAACGVSPETLREWRNGRFEPRATQLRTLARLLGTDLLSILPPE